MKLSDTESCGSTCKAQNKEGCCYLDNIHGCFWYEGSNATTVESAPTMVTATLCSAIGRRNNCINSVYVSHHLFILFHIKHTDFFLCHCFNIKLRFEVRLWQQTLSMDKL